MLFKPALLVTSALAALAVASPMAAPMEARTDGGEVRQCDPGSSQCCNSSGAAESYSGTGLLWGLITAVVSDLTATIGVGCSPILGGGSCNQTPVCCSGNNFGGLIVLGCNPIIL